MQIKALVSRKTKGRACFFDNLICESGIPFGKFVQGTRMLLKLGWDALNQNLAKSLDSWKAILTELTKFLRNNDCTV